MAPTETEMVDPRMIKFNAYDGLKLLFQKELNGGIKPAHAPTSFEQLAFLHSRACIQSLHLSGYRLHPLNGILEDCLAINLQDN